MAVFSILLEYYLISQSTGGDLPIIWLSVSKDILFFKRLAKAGYYKVKLSFLTINDLSKLLLSSSISTIIMIIINHSIITMFSISNTRSQS